MSKTNVVETAWEKDIKIYQKRMRQYEKSVRNVEMKIAEMIVREYRAEKGGNFDDAGKYRATYERMKPQLKPIREQLHKIQWAYMLLKISESESAADGHEE